MNIVYLGVLVIVAIYVLFRKRRFDFYTLAFFSTIVYYYPAIIGKIRRSANVFDIIDTRVYCCLIIQSLVLFMCMVLADKYKVVVFSGHKFGGNLVKKESCSDGDIVSNLSVLVLELVGLLLLVFTYSSYGGFQLNFNKMKLLSEANRITEYLKYIALFTFVYAFTKKGKYIRLLKVISVVLIGYTFLLGHRSFAVIGILAIFMSYFTNKLPDKVRVSSIIRKYWKIFLALMFAVVFFLFVKNVFAAFMSGQYDLVKQRLSDPNYYIDSLLSSEANSILSNLQAVCTYGMKYSVIDYFLIGIGIIPFMGSRLISSMGLILFEKQLNLNFNSQLSEGIGLGSTFLGEGYATGRYVFLCITLLFVYLIVNLLQQKHLSAKSPFSKTWILIMLVYLTFYIHRNSAFFLLVTARAYLYIWGLCFVIRSVLCGIIRKK